MQKVFGPEFAHLSGGQKKVCTAVHNSHDDITGCSCDYFRWCPSRLQPPPAQCESVTGRRVVRVVLLNGCSVDFTVEVCTLLYSVSAVW